MRLPVYGSYEHPNVYILRFRGGSDDGDVFRKLTHRMVFSVGEKPCGYFVRFVRFGNREFLSVVEISEDERQLGASALNKRCHGRRGTILKPYMVGTWATTDEEAADGLLLPDAG